MVRIVKSADVRQAEILDTAQLLFYTKGYDNTSVRDIIDEVGIAKGTFYHHFNAKEELLDALIVRLLEQSLTILEPILADEQLTALEKLHSFFNEVSNLKMENEALIRTLISTWYDDSNVIMREKIKQRSLDMFAPLYAQIVQQGIEEGVFTVEYPKEMGGIVFLTMYFMGETLAKLMINDEKIKSWPIVEHKLVAYNSALESLLNAPTGSIQLFEFEPFRHWFEKEEENN
jgi:TetR/AcrR family transcriptional regulator, transcriptional repressor for nem operon